MPNHKARLHADQHRYLGTAQAIAKPHRLEVVTGNQVMATLCGQCPDALQMRARRFADVLRLPAATVRVAS